jgi:uncharacterized protein
MALKRFSPQVAEKLKYYVYLYIDPNDGRIFYVGKGQGNRVFAHLDDRQESRKVQRLDQLRAQGQEPIIEIVVHGLQDELIALRIEAAVIDLLGQRQLTNAIRGWGSRLVGRMEVSELVSQYEAIPVAVSEPAILIRINQLYRSSMSPTALYEATHGVWKLGVRRQQAHYALAVFQGVVKAVYRIESWHPAGTTPYETRLPEQVDAPGRWEFVGEPAEAQLLEKYVGKSVASILRRTCKIPSPMSTASLDRSSPNSTCSGWRGIWAFT